MYVVAAAVGAGGGWLGLAVAYRASIDHDLRLAPGATIVLATTVLFAAVLGGRGLVRLAAQASRRRAAAAGVAAG
jgi:manganese/iron transport system permease protein